MSNINISIITLTRDDHKRFSRTLRSLNSQTKDFFIEWLVIDGSDSKIQKINRNLIKKFFSDQEKKNFIIKYINSKQKNIVGIYNCMNYGKEIASGDFLMFLNSGDIFFNKKSLEIFCKNSLFSIGNSSLIFGQANIISTNNLNWIFPGERLSNIQKWLTIFEPNHQAMLVSRKLAKEYDFPEKYLSIADGFWKRKIIENAKDIIFIKTPLIKFYLDGISSIKPNRKNLQNILKNRNISFTRKIVFLVKYLLPKYLFVFYHVLQKYKSLLVDLIF